MEVEDLKEEPHAMLEAAVFESASPPTDLSAIAKVNRFPHGLRP